MIILFIFIFLLCDLLLSYRYIATYRLKFPKNDWTLVEANPLLRKSIRMHGLEQGLCVGGFVLAVLIMVIVYFVPYQWHYFILGMYFMNNTFHFINWQALKRIKVKKVKKK